MVKFENKSNGRFYYLLVHKDMLNEWVLTIIRGGIHSRCVRHFGYHCRIRIEKEIQRISKKRLKNGYTLMSQ